jgi:hypothetical protein
MLRRIQEDAATHRDVNHGLANLSKSAANPFPTARRGPTVSEAEAHVEIRSGRAQ